MPRTGLDRIKKIADEYAALKKLAPIVHDIKPVAVNTERAQKIAQAFENMQHIPNDPAVQKSYQALINETKDQFQKLKESGLKIDKISPDMQNPYKSSDDLFKDLEQNNHMWYYPTEQGFGSGGIQDHPLLQTVDVGGEKMPANDLFRIVHDYFGHAKSGYQFGPKGEEAAWRAHMPMYSPEAQKALTTETRGQNSWVNYGPHGEANRANPANTKFAEQKAGLLPDWAYDKSAIAALAAGGASAGVLGSQPATAESISPVPSIEYGMDAVRKPIAETARSAMDRIVSGTTPLQGQEKEKFVEENAPIFGGAAEMATDPMMYVPGGPELDTIMQFPKLRQYFNK